MNKENIFNDFTNQYSISKTLKFALKPVGETEEKIKNNKFLKGWNDEDVSLLKKDEQRAEDYKKAKKIIDEYHKHFIDKNLKNFSFDVEDLKNFEDIYFKLKENKKNKEKQKELKKLQDKLRRKVSDDKEDKKSKKEKGIFNTEKDSPFGKEFIEGNKKQGSILIHLLEEEYDIKSINEKKENGELLTEQEKNKEEEFNKKKKIIQQSKEKNQKSILINWLEEEYDIKSINEKKENGELLTEQEKNKEKEFNEKKKIIQQFKGWTTYFKGFEDNRKNIYTSKEHSTSIGYRLVHDNLPKFLENKENYQKAKDEKINFTEIKENLKNLKIEVKENIFESLNQFFELKYFNKTLTQEGINIYNQILGGITLDDENKTKLKGINECINLHGQSLVKAKKELTEDQKKKQEKKIKAVYGCKMKELYKQILSDREGASFRSEPIKNDKELIEELKTFTFQNGDLIYKNNEEEFNLTKNLKNNNENYLFGILENKADLKEVYLKNDTAITDISQSIFGEYFVIKNTLDYYFTNKNLKTNKNNKKTKLNKEEAEKELNKDYFSFDEIINSLKFYFENDCPDELKKFENDNKSNLLIEYFKNLEVVDKDTNKKFHILEKIRETFGSKTNNETEKNKRNILEIINEFENTEEEKLKNEEQDRLKIQEYLSSIKILQFFLRPFYVKIKKKDEGKQNQIFNKDPAFYSEFDKFYETLIKINDLFDRARNYLTKKSFSIEKYKLNFEKATLLEGWDKNKEENKNNAVIFREEDKYYLGILSTKYKKKFFTKEDNLIWNNNSTFKKMTYKDLGDIKRQLPRIAFSKKAEDGNENLGWTEEINKIKNEFDSFQEEKKNNKDKWKDEFCREKLNVLIDYYKSALKNHSEKYVDNYEIKFEDTKNYKHLGDFFNHVQDQTYKLNFNKGVDKNEILELVKQGKFYLFQIYSKDFSDRSKGKPNLQTLYWQELFSEENLKNVIYKLNGKAELFFRKASLKYDDKIMEKGHHYKEKLEDDKKKDFIYPIMKNKRYAKNTYLFHVPITCNFKAKGVSKFFNDEVLKKIKKNLQENKEDDKKNNNKAIKIIGIDRGERHLAYYSVINQKGKIIDQESFNNPLGRKDYHELLDIKEKERDKARKSWGTIGKIKDLKTGYLSQVVHKICQLMIKHNAIVVFEDLNMGFKRGRFKVEKQIYQKLEKALIDKLNFLVFKNLDFLNLKEEGKEEKFFSNALQLTAPFESFKKMGNQTGFIFYVNAYHTSKICPTTGFVNLLYPRYETIAKVKDFFKRFKSINFDGKHFQFSFNYDEMYKKNEKIVNWFNKTPKGLDGCKKDWIVYSVGERLENFRDKKNNNKWNTRKVNLTDELKKLFSDNSIDYSDSECIKEEIQKQNKSEFFKELIRLLRLTLQMRNSGITGSNFDKEDYLISPVKDNEDNFFDSREVENNEMPKDADANGAYHIAMKGLQLLKKLGDYKDNDISKFKNDNTNEEWYKFIQNK